MSSPIRPEGSWKLETEEVEADLYCDIYYKTTSSPWLNNEFLLLF